MARMFSTDFTYKNATYEATVVIGGVDNDQTIAIELPEELKSIVPKRKLIVKAGTGENQSGFSEDPALVKSILAAIDKHEENKPVANLWG